ETVQKLQRCHRVGLVDPLTGGPLPKRFGRAVGPAQHVHLVPCTPGVCLRCLGTFTRVLSTVTPDPYLSVRGTASGALPGRQVDDVDPVRVCQAHPPHLGGVVGDERVPHPRAGGVPAVLVTACAECGPHPADVPGPFWLAVVPMVTKRWLVHDDHGVCGPDVRQVLDDVFTDLRVPDDHEVAGDPVAPMDETYSVVVHDLDDLRVHRISDVVPVDRSREEPRTHPRGRLRTDLLDAAVGAVTEEPEIAHVKDVEVKSAPLRGEGVTNECSGDGRRIGQQGRAEVSPGPFLFTHRSVPV